jgi:DNA-binding transcriptional MerR regulator
MNLRIRTIARLTGIREATLRAWERRYGFPTPARGQNNYRGYSQDEVEALRRVAALLGEGLSASEAIGQVRNIPAGTGSAVEQLRNRFWTAAAAMDTDAADAALAEAQRDMPPLALCDEFFLPLLRQMADKLDVAREHLASTLIRQRLRALVLAPGPTVGRRAVLACPSGERHEGGLLGLGLHLKAAGFRLTLLGADTPAEAVVEGARHNAGEVVALSFVTPRPVEDMDAFIRSVTRGVRVPVMVGGAFAREHVALVAEAGGRFGETAEDVARVLGKTPMARAR